MDVLQGRYLKQIKSNSGQLKGLKLEMAEGVQTIYLPKALREIAVQELEIGDEVRVWSKLDAKQGQKKQGQRKQNKKSKVRQRHATGLIPLSPKPKISPLAANKVGGIGTQKGIDLKKAKSKSKKAKSKKAKGKLVTVQLCQKKNCCKKGGTTLWKAFEGQRNTEASSFKLEAVGCLGGCKRGPNIRFLPKNVKHYHVQPNEVAGLLKKYRA